MPKRVKVTKKFSEDEMLVFFKKNRLYVKSVKKVDGKIEVNESSLEEVLDRIECKPDTPSIPIDDDFWTLYEKAKEEKVGQIIPASELSLERKALNNIDALLRNNIGEKLTELKPFIRVLREDILDYGTLPDYTLRRIAQLKLNNLDSVIEELTEIRNELGDDYLEKEKKKYE
ncbi:MAG: helicase-related protein, partial [Ignavibacterium sp.]